jgi:putative ABC transport system permease protein
MKSLFPAARCSGHYLKAIVRNFFRNRFYSALSLAGLSLGFAVFIYALIYAHYETSFEAFHEKADRIYPVTYRFDNGEDFQVHWARTPADFVNNLTSDFPAIEKFVRLQNHARKYIRVGEEKFIPRHA